MNDAVEDEYMQEGKEMHSDDMTEEEAMDDENEELLDDENGVRQMMRMKK